MIIIIADDLSGAAELAGVARGVGLTAEVHTEFDPASTAEVVAIDTDTRALDEAAAVAKVKAVAARVVAARPAWIYKKTDSVLRGHVLAECRAIAEVAGKTRVLLLPANPGRQRVIRDGRYLIAGTPLDHGPFARDPQWPARTAEVVKLLAAEPDEACSLRVNASAPGKGVVIPDVWEPLHLRDRAREVDDCTLAAGAMEFFSALLHRAPIRSSSPPELSARAEATVFACGSHAAWSGSRLRECQAHGVPIVAMPRRVFADDFAVAELDQWAAEAVDALAIDGRVMLAIGGEKITGMPPGKLESRLAEAVRRVFHRATIGHLLLEGGATAAAVFRACGWSRLRVGDEVAPGLARLEVLGRPAPLLLIKPGSYPWPEGVWSGRLTA